MVDATGVAQVLKDMSLKYILEHGKLEALPKRKEPFTVQMIEAMLMLPNGTKIGRATIQWDDYVWLNTGGLYTLTTWTGMRKSEGLIPDGRPFDMSMASRSQIVWIIADKTVTSPTGGQLQQLDETCIMLWIPGCSKADQEGKKWAGTPVAIRWHATNVLTAARWMQRIELAFPVSGDDRKRTPLFTVQPSTHAPMRFADVERVLRPMLVATGLVSVEEAKVYSFHSFRIFLASALKAMKVADDDIQRLLRWSSREAMLVYTRPSREWQASTIEATLMAAPKLDVRQAANLAPDVDDYGLGLSFDDMIASVQSMHV
jgi:hypothetical protein